jgi:hypothetical protein
MADKWVEIALACRDGWGACKDALAAEYLGVTDRRAALVKVAEEHGLPASTGHLADDCLSGDEDACAEVAAILGVFGACQYLTGGACKQCCGLFAGPMVDVLWPFLGPLFESGAEVGVSLVEAALESVGLKDAPSFGDVAYQMEKEAVRKDTTARNAWMAEFPTHAPVLDRHLNNAYRYNVGMHKECEYGTVYVEHAPRRYQPKWSLSWDYAWDRDDAFASGAEALQHLYATRHRHLGQAILAATAQMAAQTRPTLTVRQRPKVKKQYKLPVKKTETRRPSVAVATAAPTAGVAAAVALWMLA